MKTSTICTLLFVALCCLILPQQAKAQSGSCIASLYYDSYSGEVYGYAATQVDYSLQRHYDAEVFAALYDQYGSTLDSRYSIGHSFASVNLQAPGYFNSVYSLYSDHYVIAYYYTTVRVIDCDFCERYYYDDFFGFGFLPGGLYDGGYDFYGPGPDTYFDYQEFYVCSILLSIATPGIPPPPSGENFDLQINSPRANGNLNGTTQNALLGANVTLDATVIPSTLANGTYRWSFSGPYQLASGSTSNRSIQIRWTQPGNYVAQIDYIRNGVGRSATVNINVILPTLDSFTGSQDSGETLIKVTFDNFCGPVLGTVFSLGCSNPATSEMYEPGTGINFVAQASVPQGLISDPSQSKIKFVQLVNSYRKRQVMGQQGYECESTRNRTPPWSIDSSDPYDSYIGRYYAVVDFATANPAIIKTGDNPAAYVETEGVLPSYNYLYIDEQFEMYVVYFTTTDPNIQIPLSRVRWNWGGEVVYDTTASNNYRINSAFSTLGIHPSEAVSSFTPYSGTLRASDFQWLPCGGSGCDPDGSAQRACGRRGYKYEWDPDTCNCVYTGGF